MGVVFSYFWPSESAAERELKLLREENQAAERRTKLQNLLITMASFVSQHSSHSLCPETSLSDKKSGTESVSFSRILELAQVELPDPMQRSKWREMRWKVNLVNYNPTTERVGVHPRLQRILQLLVDGDESPFKLVYEGSFEDRDCIVQRPDFALVLKMMNIERVPLSACVTNLEAKIQGLLSCGTSQSFGYGMLSLLEVVQLVGDAILETDLSIMCFGSDGTDLAVGYIALSHGSLTVHSTGTEKICLWLTKAVDEPDSIRLLRYVVSGQHGLHKQAINRRVLRVAPAVDVEVLSVLGSGAFSIVFVGRVRGTGSDIREVVVKAARLDAPRSREKAYEIEIVRESSILAAFLSLTSPYLPFLVAEYGPTSAEFPYLCTRDAGMSLAQYLHKQPKAKRRLVAQELKDHLCAGLAAALRVGYCHADLRPENVVRIGGEDGVFQIIDWGLAVVPHTLTHPHKGGKAFFADDLVIAANTSNYPILFRPDYDQESVLYVCYAVVLGARNLAVPWADAGGGLSYINCRAEEVCKEVI